MLAWPAKFDPTGATVFWILVGMVLVGIGLSRLRTPATTPDGPVRAWRGRRGGIAMVAAGLVTVLGMGLALLVGP